MNQNVEYYENSTNYTHSQGNDVNTDDPESFEYISQFDMLQLSQNFRKNSAESKNSDNSFQNIYNFKPKHRFGSYLEKIKFIEDYKRKQKTELCKTFSETGKCRYGDNCSFAHGIEELQQKQHLHENYKTKPCKKFFDNMYCNYGSRCQYLHVDIFNYPKFEDYLKKLYLSKNLNISTTQNSLQIIQNIMNSYKDENILNLNYHKRLSIFLRLQELNKLSKEKNYDYQILL